MRFGHLVLASLVVLAACDHAPPPTPAPARVWPEAPLAPRVRFAATFPDAARAPAPPWWKRAWQVIIGTAARGRTRPLLARPFGVAASERELYVTDPDGAQVLRVDWRASRSEPVTCREHDWRMPMGVALDGDALYVADGGAGVVARLEPGGACQVLGAGRLVRPVGLTVADGLVWVVDPPAHDVVAFDRTGREVRRLGARGTGDGDLNYPTAVTAVDGRLWVVDALNFRLEAFGANGAYLGSFGQPGDRVGDFGRPKAVSAHDGRLYVSDGLHDVVLVFRPSGDLDLVIGGSGTGPGDLLLPAGVATAGDHLFVADSYNHRVEIYDLLGETP